MRLTEITDDEPTGLRILRNLVAKGTPVGLDILDERRIVIRHFFDPDQSPVNSYIQCGPITSMSPPRENGGLVNIFAKGKGQSQDYVIVPINDFDDILTLQKQAHQWVLTNATD